MLWQFFLLKMSILFWFVPSKAFSLMQPAVFWSLFYWTLTDTIIHFTLRSFVSLRLLILTTHHHHHHHKSLNREGRWGTTDDFAPVFSIFPCSPLPYGTFRTPGLSIPWCWLPTSSSVCLVFFPFSLCLARWFWPDLMNRRHDHTTAICVSLRSSGLLVVQLPAGSWHGLLRC